MIPVVGLKRSSAPAERVPWEAGTTMLLVEGRDDSRDGVSRLQ